MKGKDSTYRPEAGTICQMSGPNEDDDAGYAYNEPGYAPRTCSPPIWVDPPDCPRCGKPLTAIEHTHGQWICSTHEDDGKCLWYDYELVMILRSKLSEANAEHDTRQQNSQKGQTT